MRKVNLKQGSIQWLSARSSRIGASEAYAIIRHYASENELLNCGIQPDDIISEVPFIGVYALYQKIAAGATLNNISIWDSEFGHALEAWFKNKFSVKPKSPVYLDHQSIVSLDAIDGSGCEYVPDGAIVEIKTNRHKTTKLAWVIQATLQCAAAQRDEAYIAVISLFDVSEARRGAVVNAYNTMGKRKFFKYIDTLNPQVDVIKMEYNPKLFALWKVCLERFFYDLKLNLPPLPIIGEIKDKSSIKELLSNYNDEVNIAEEELLEYEKSCRLLKEAQEYKNITEQKLFEYSVKNKARALKSENMMAKWSASGALLLKRLK